MPSSTEGIYVQRFDSREWGLDRIDAVCLCWLKTKGDRNIDFDVVFYEEVAGRPAESPWATISSSAGNVANSVQEAGSFVRVKVGPVAVPEGPFFLGARWDPSRDPWLFICADQSDAEGRASVFFRDDRSPGWASVSESRDPIFRAHRTILIRATSRKRAGASGSCQG